MNTVAEYIEAMPDYALPYLINADSSGLSDDDQVAIDRYMAQFYQEAKACNGHVIISPKDEEASFTHRPAFGLACNAIDTVILIVN